MDYLTIASRRNIKFTQLVNIYMKSFEEEYKDKNVDRYIQGMYELPLVWSDIYDIEYRIDFSKYKVIEIQGEHKKKKDAVVNFYIYGK